MKRILICGSNGLLGQRLSLLLSTRTEYEVLNTSIERTFVFDDKLFDYTQLDITSRSDVKSLISSFQPTVIFNAAAATNVDWCETHREETWKLNVVAVENLAEAARRVNAKLIHVSTDYIFDGKAGPYTETAQPNPLGYYGKSKLASENVVLSANINYAIVRTMVLFGYGINVKPNFALWVLQNLRQGNRIRVVDDQQGNATYVGDLAIAMIKLFELDKVGVYNVAGRDILSRYDFAVQIAEVFGFDPSLIQRIKSSELQQTAPRPMKSGLIVEKAERELGIRFHTAREGLLKLKQELEDCQKN
ncbi:MAG: dTDP-4-dehydrorhamnose reductase [Bacteroidetes bacterium]|nr:dTDP-4-dehydrorhamnose reductase [Bacteroidota bacterium]